MKTRSSALYQRTERYRQDNSGWLGASTALVFALMPLALLVWAITTGYGFA